MTRFANTAFCSVSLTVLILLLFAAKPVAAEPPPASFAEFLMQTGGFSEEELDHLAAGSVMVNVFDVEDRHEMILGGVSRVDASWEFVLENFKQVVEYRRKEGKVQIERVGLPPEAADFETFSLPDDDIKDLKKAKRGNSNVKITEALLTQLQKEVDWSGDYVDDVNRIFREMLLQRTTAYLEGGIDNLAPYIDKDLPQTVRSGMEPLFESSTVLYEYFPEFSDYLSKFPTVDLEGTTDLVYCVFEDFGMKPTLSTRHVTIYQPVEARQVKFIVSEINLYSSHYSQAMYSLVMFLESEIRNEGTSSYVIWVQRFWYDNELKGMKRRSAEGRLSDAMKNKLERQFQRVNEAYKNQR